MGVLRRMLLSCPQPTTASAASTRAPLALADDEPDPGAVGQPPTRARALRDDSAPLACGRVLPRDLADPAMEVPDPRLGGGERLADDLRDPARRLERRRWGWWRWGRWRRRRRWWLRRRTDLDRSRHSRSAGGAVVDAVIREGAVGGERVLVDLARRQSPRGERGPVVRRRRVHRDAGGVGPADRRSGADVYDARSEAVVRHRDHDVRGGAGCYPPPGRVNAWADAGTSTSAASNASQNALRIRAWGRR